MLALCLMFSVTYYAQNYAGIIGWALLNMQFIKLYKGNLIIEPCLVETKEEITCILAKWTWKDMRPISIICDKGLIELYAFLEPNYWSPSTMHVGAWIQKDFEDGKATCS